MRAIIALLIALPSLIGAQILPFPGRHRVSGGGGGNTAVVGSFALNAVTGNQSVTTGNQPKAVIFFASADQTADGSTAAGSRGVIGFAVDSTHRAFQWGGAGGGTTTTTTTSQALLATKAFGIYVEANTTPTLKVDADLVSMDATGFTINITTTDGVARIVNYIAIGGTGISAFVGTGTTGTATGNKAYTGFGFQPDVVFMAAGSNNSLAVSSTGIHALGWGSSSSSRGAAWVKSRSAQATTDATGYQRTVSLVGEFGNGTALQTEGDLVSMDADGITVNYTTANATGRELMILALKGVSVAIGSITQPASTGNQSVTGLAFQPNTVLFVSDNLAAATTGQSNARFTFGAATDSTHRGVVWMGDRNGITLGTTIANSDLDRTKCIKLETEGASTPTVNASADFVSMNSDGFTVNWGAADGTARQVLYLAIK